MIQVLILVLLRLVNDKSIGIGISIAKIQLTILVSVSFKELGIAHPWISVVVLWIGNKIIYPICSSLIPLHWIKKVIKNPNKLMDRG